MLCIYYCSVAIKIISENNTEIVLHVHRNPEITVSAYVELYCVVIIYKILSYHSFFFITRNYRHLFIYRAKGSSVYNKTLICTTPHGERECLTPWLSSEQPVKGSCCAHDFILLPSQLFSPFHPLPSAPEFKIL